jgi:tetratricopeptide (TPR) repeat protein
MTELSAVAEAREVASRYAWRDAFDLLARADAAAPLGPDELDLMAECAWWLGKMRHCIALRERAFTAYRKREDARRAARVALDLTQHHGDLGETGDAAAWLQNASRLLEVQSEGAEHGWLLLARAMVAHDEGHLDEAVRFAEEAARLGEHHADPDLLALGLAFHGVGLVFSGESEDGLRLVEEATQAAVAGDLGARATGSIYCLMITVSSQVADWERAGHWTEAAKRWCDRQAINGFPGVCRVHRAEILRLRGFLSEAEEEARVATAELGSFNLMFSAMAFRELGEVRLRLGDLDAAEDAFRLAAEMGVTPQPGIALALVERGRVQAAATGLRRTLAGKGMGALERAKLLPTQVDIALMLDDLPTARAAVEELVAIAADHRTPALRAMAAAGEAGVLLAEGTALAGAEDAARDARTTFTEIELSYEAARVSQLIGRILWARGEQDRARAEFLAALEMFERIGAVTDAQRTSAMLAESTPSAIPTSDAGRLRGDARDGHMPGR